MILRLYQKQAADATFKEWEEHQSTMIVLPTGTGKTVTFTELVRRMLPKRSLILAHRYELIHQAAKHIERLGVGVEIEMADKKASTNLFHQAPVVVASVQTMISGQNVKRMQKFHPNDFAMLIIDEGHHATSASYVSIINHFKSNPNLKIFGCTATPDRADEQALGKVFESVAFVYELADAINDGWLVPIEQQMVHVGHLDYTHVRTTAGDLNASDLEAVMLDEQNLQGMCGASIEIIKERKSIAFASSVRHAEKCAEIFNRHRSGMAAWICGETPPQERQLLLKDFASGKTQVLVNVGITTEGFDSPDCQCVIMGRPTKSRALFTQCVGRGTRPLPGILDDLHSSYERKEAIAASKKAVCLVMDFVGNSGRHKLVSTADILGGDYSDEAVELATKKAKEADGPVKMKELLEESEDEIRQRMEAARLAEEARKAKIVAKVSYVTRTVNPFDLLDIKPVRERGWDQGKTISEKMAKILVKMGVSDPYELPYGQARQLLNNQFSRWQNHLATLKQIEILRKRGIDAKQMTAKEASLKIDEIAAREGWKKQKAA